MKRSDLVTITVAGVALATSAALAPSYQRLERKRYSDRHDCECDYSPAQCQSSEGSEIAGPWYARDEDIRRKDANDPGTGRCYGNTGSSGGSSGYGYRPGSRGYVTTEQGYRNGFGTTAHRGTPPRS